MGTQGRFLFDNSGAAMIGVWIHRDLGYVTFFYLGGFLGFASSFFAAFIPFVPLGVGRCAEEEVRYRSPSAHYVLTSLRFVLK